MSFNPGLSFPSDIIEKINTYNEAIIVEANKPYFPSKNKFGFIEIPYVKVILLAGGQESEFLGYTWLCTEVTSTSMTFKFDFENPLKISMENPPEQVQFEFHI